MTVAWNVSELKMPNCSVFACKRTSETSNKLRDNVTFHLFPKDATIRDAWIQACANHVSWTPKRTSTICSQHFEASCFIAVANNKRRLKQCALPTLKLSKLSDPSEGQSSSGTGESKAKGRASTCKSTKLIPLLKQAEDIIASVYNYLQAEYEQLKSSIGTSCDLSPLANILERTAAATGVSEHAVSAILEEKKRAADEELEASGAKRAKLTHDYGDGDVSPITDDESSREAPDEEQDHVTEQDDNNEQTHDNSQESDDCEVETLKVEIKEEEEDDRSMDPLQYHMSETENAVQHLMFSSNSDRANISTATDITDSVEIRQPPAVVVYPQPNQIKKRRISKRCEPEASELVRHSEMQSLHLHCRVLPKQKLLSDSGVLRVMSIEPLMSPATVKTEPDDDTTNSDTTSCDVTRERPPS